MTGQHLDFIVEEPSMEAFLRGLLPNIIGMRATFEVYPHQCKDDLIKNLPARLLGYSAWLPDSRRIVVVLDCDNDECSHLKVEIEKIVEKAGLRSRAKRENLPWQIVTRIAIEELEAWYFGDWAAKTGLSQGKSEYSDTSALSPSRRNQRWNMGSLRTLSTKRRVTSKADYAK